MTRRAPKPFLLTGDLGKRFALHRPSAGGTRSRGAVLYVPPFAEEMNKSRRLASLQAKAFAAVGYDVLSVDLYGCGDSDGDLRDARWNLWKRDVAQATQWLEQRGRVPVHLWGLRLGATLALDCWQDAPTRYASAVIWQPVQEGKNFLTQFLRLAVAREALRQGERVTTDTLRRRLASGESLEVAGYALGPELAADIEARRLMNFSIPGARLYWLEVRAAPSSEPPPVVESALSSWRSQRIGVDYRSIVGQPFWSSVEIVEVPDLIAATTSFYAS